MATNKQLNIKIKQLETALINVLAKSSATFTEDTQLMNLNKKQNQCMWGVGYEIYDGGPLKVMLKLSCLGRTNPKSVSSNPIFIRNASLQVCSP